MTWNISKIYILNLFKNMVILNEWLIISPDEYFKKYDSGFIYSFMFKSFGFQARFTILTANQV